MYHPFSYLYNLTRSMIFPYFCSYCRTVLKYDSILCNACKKLIQPIASFTMPVTEKYSMNVIALSAYKDPLKHLILAKGNSKTILKSKQLGTLLWQMTSIRSVKFDYIIPIPLHWSRFAWRGYNQAEVIADVIAYKSKKPLAHILKRIKRTTFQSKLDSKKRSHNLKNAFCFNNENMNNYKEKHLLLVDDLMTTGTTLQVAAKKLIKLKPASITVLVACRVI